MKLLPSRHFLEPSVRIAEVLFGLIMVLTFTGSLSAATAGRSEVRTMLIGALGCNFAWGIIDAIFYLMGCLATKGHGIRVWRAFNKAPNPEAARLVISKRLPPLIASKLTAVELEAIRQKLLNLGEAPKHPGLALNEWLGAVMVFLWVFIITFPVAIPFLVIQDVSHAMRASNAVALVMLFITGYAFGRCAEYRPWLAGLAMMLIGSGLVALTIKFGG